MSPYFGLTWYVLARPLIDKTLLTPPQHPPKRYGSAFLFSDRLISWEAVRFKDGTTKINSLAVHIAR